MPLPLPLSLRVILGDDLVDFRQLARVHAPGVCSTVHVVALWLRCHFRLELSLLIRVIEGVTSWALAVVGPLPLSLVSLAPALTRL